MNAAPTPFPPAGRPCDGRLMGLLLAAAVAVLRAPGFAAGIANLDECDFALFGRMVQAGAVPYRGVADIKPPLTYLAYHAAERLAGGPSFIAVHVLGAGCILATALLLGAAARSWTGDVRVGWAAAWLSVLAIVCESPASNAEILMNVPVAVALLAAVLATRRPALHLFFACGAALGVASLVKQQAGVGLLAFALAPFVPSRERGGNFGRGVLRACVLGTGFALPWAVALAVASRGDLAAFLEWVFARNLHQVSDARALSAWRALGSVGLCLSATLLVWLLAVRRAVRARDEVGIQLAILLALTWIPVSLGGRFYEHYFLQFAPPLALLAAPELIQLLERWTELGRARRTVVVALATLPFLGSVGYATVRVLRHDFPGQERTAVAIASWLEHHTAPGDRVFMWGDYSVVYCLADRLPGTRYMRTAPHVGDFDPMQLPAGQRFQYQSERDIALTLEDLETNHPAIVVDTSAADLHGWSRFPLSDVPELDRYVQDHYAKIAEPGGARVYARRPTLTRAVSLPSR
jgi:hypothetical protein